MASVSVAARVGQGAPGALHLPGAAGLHRLDGRADHPLRQIGGPAPLAGPFDAAKYAPAAAELWARLNALKPALWRGGTTYPQTQDAVEKLYSDGEISAYFTYGPGAVGDKVRNGAVPAIDPRGGAVAGQHRQQQLPRQSPTTPHTEAAALVLANVLEDPQTQLALYKAEGIYPGHRPRQDRRRDPGRSSRRSRSAPRSCRWPR